MCTGSAYYIERKVDLHKRQDIHIGRMAVYQSTVEQVARDAGNNGITHSQTLQSGIGDCMVPRPSESADSDIASARHESEMYTLSVFWSWVDEMNTERTERKGMSDDDDLYARQRRAPTTFHLRFDYFLSHYHIFQLDDFVCAIRTG